MTVPSLTPLPTAPARTDAPATFIARADTFLGAVVTFQSEMNTSVAAFNTDFSTVNANVTAAQLAETNAELAETNAETAQASAESAEAGSIAAKDLSIAAKDLSVIAQVAAEAALDEFTDIYLGAFASDPTTDNDGDPLAVGMFYYNTTTDVTRIYNGSAWQDVAATATSITLSQVTDVTATAAEVNYLDITALGTTEASKAVTADADGVVTFDNGIIEEYNATGTSGAVTIDMDTGTNFSTALAGAVTYTFSNPATSGKVSSFTLKVVNDGSAITWPASVDWASATAPTLSASPLVDYFVFTTNDGGTTWYGFTAGQAMA